MNKKHFNDWCKRLNNNDPVFMNDNLLCKLPEEIIRHIYLIQADDICYNIGLLRQRIKKIWTYNEAKKFLKVVGFFIYIDESGQRHYCTFGFKDVPSEWSDYYFVFQSEKGVIYIQKYDEPIANIWTYYDAKKAGLFHECIDDYKEEFNNYSNVISLKQWRESHE